MKQSIHLSQTDILIFCTALFMLLVQGCSETPPAPESIAKGAPNVTVQSETSNVEEEQVFDIDNCNGKAAIKRTERRSQSIDTAISSELAATLGASIEVITAEIQAAVGSSIGQGRQQSTAIELVAPPESWMHFELVWMGSGKTGTVQNLRGFGVPIAFQSFTPQDVQIRRQYDIGCNAVVNPIPTPINSATAIVTLVLTSAPTDLPTITPSPIPVSSETPTLADSPIVPTVLPDGATIPLYGANQSLRVRINSNMWTEPDVTQGVRFDVAEAGTIIETIENPVWGPARTDYSIYGWWYPSKIKNRTVWIIEDNLGQP